MVEIVKCESIQKCIYTGDKFLGKQHILGTDSLWGKILVPQMGGNCFFWSRLGLKCEMIFGWGQCQMLNHNCLGNGHKRLQKLMEANGKAQHRQSVVVYVYIQIYRMNWSKSQIRNKYFKMYAGCSKKYMPINFF